MSASRRKKAKADAIAGHNALWVPVAPRIILIRSRMSSDVAEFFGIPTHNLSIDSRAIVRLAGVITL